jgi:hypothetical protein
MKKLLKVLNRFSFLVGIFLISFAYAQQDILPANPSTSVAPTSQEKIIYEYKKEDYFDFEALSVKGELLTPGDLSGKAVKRVKFNSKEYIRKDFDDFIEDDLMEIY